MRQPKTLSHLILSLSFSPSPHVSHSLMNHLIVYLRVFHFLPCSGSCWGKSMFTQYEKELISPCGLACMSGEEPTTLVHLALHPLPLLHEISSTSTTHPSIGRPPRNQQPRTSTNRGATFNITRLVTGAKVLEREREFLDFPLLSGLGVVFS